MIVDDVWGLGENSLLLIEDELQELLIEDDLEDLLKEDEQS